MTRGHLNAPLAEPVRHTCQNQGLFVEIAATFAAQFCRDQATVCEYFTLLVHNPPQSSETTCQHPMERVFHTSVRGMTPV